MAKKNNIKTIKKPLKRQPKKEKGKSARKAAKASNSVIIVKPAPLDPLQPVNTPMFPEESIKKIITYVKSGRKPTEFKPEYVEQILTLMSQGMGIESVCLQMGISYNVMLYWRKNNKDINELIKFGKELEKAWWIEQGRRNIYNKDFNHVLWMMNMSNRFKWATNRGKVEGKIAKLNLHKVEGKIEVEEKMKNVNRQPERITTVISILAKSGAFIKPEPVKRISDSSDSETD